MSTDTNTDNVERFIDWSEELNAFAAFVAEDIEDDDPIYEAVLATAYVTVEFPEIADSVDEEELAWCKQFLDHNRGNVDAVLAALTSDGWFEVIFCQCCGDPNLVPAFPAWLLEDDDDNDD